MAREGGITAAAKRLGMPKSTVSRQLARLEERLGVQLVHRTTRRVRLTEAGQGYYARCAHGIDAIEEAERFALDAMDRPAGTLRVSMSYDMAALYIAPLLADFRARYPHVNLDVACGTRVVDLIDEGFDVALRGGVLDDSSLIARRVATSGLVLAAAPAYLDAHGRPRTPADMTGHHGILLSQVRAMGGLRLLGPDGPVAVPLDPWLTVNEFQPLHRATLDGLGIGLLEANMIRDDLRAGRLERVLPNHALGPDGGLYAVYPATHHLTPKVRAFVDFVVEHLGPRFAADGRPPPG